MKALLVCCLGLSLPALAGAQDQTAVVAVVKDALVAQGVNLTGSCGAFQITKRVAWRLRGTGAGLLDKPSGNQCDGYAVDIIAYGNGNIVDMLIDSGGSNGPTWGVGVPVDPSRWRAPFNPDPEPDPAPAPIPPPVVTPPPLPSTDLTPLLLRMAAVEAKLDALAKAEEEHTAAIREDIKSFREAAQSYLKDMLKYVLPVIAALFGGKAL